MLQVHVASGDMLPEYWRDANAFILWNDTQTMAKVRVTVPATSSNLGPGLNSLAIALGLHNIIELEHRSEGLTFEMSGKGASTFPENTGNLVAAGAIAAFRRAGCAPGGLHITLNSNVPPGCGLGTSASAILGGLVAANVLIGNQLTRHDLLETAATFEENTATLSAALLGGLSISVYDEEQLTYSNLSLPPMQVVIAIPQLEPGGPRAPLPSTIDTQQAAIHIGRTALVVQALTTGNFELLEHALKDRLHVPSRSKLIPGYRWATAAARRFGAAAVTVSGAGPGLIAFTERNHEEIAAMMARAFRESANVETDTYILPVDSQGISISEIGLSSMHVVQSIPASEHPASISNKHEVSEQPD